MEQNAAAAQVEINALGQPCPMPLLMLKRALKQADAHQFFLLKASDPNSEIDILRYCQLHQLKCTLHRQQAHEFHYFIET